MTQINIIEKRKKALEQKKNRLKEMEATLNAQERKRRTRHLIELGGLMAKAKVDGWNPNTLLGALLELKEKEKDKKQIEAWTQKGGAAFAKDKPFKTPVIVKFEDKPSPEVRSSLRSFGLKWNALRQEWGGYTDIQELQTLIKDQKATIEELSLVNGE